MCDCMKDYKLIDAEMLTKKQAIEYCNKKNMRLPYLKDFKENSNISLFSGINSIWINDLKEPVETWRIAVMFEKPMGRLSAKDRF